VVLIIGKMGELKQMYYNEDSTLFFWKYKGLK
jgi:hypothetical protein